MTFFTWYLIIGGVFGVLEVYLHFDVYGSETDVGEALTYGLFTVATWPAVWPVRLLIVLAR